LAEKLFFEEIPGNFSSSGSRESSSDSDHEKFFTMLRRRARTRRESEV